MSYLTKAGFMRLIHDLSMDSPDHWGRKESAQGKPAGLDRWLYHQKAIDILKSLKPASVLEAGSLGIKVASESDTIDLDMQNDGWKLTYTPTYTHDLRVIPWPVRNKQYDVFVALRVFHHLSHEAACIAEMERIANHIILALPEYAAKRYKAVKCPDEEYHFSNTDTTILVYHQKHG